MTWGNSRRGDCGLASTPSSCSSTMRPRIAPSRSSGCRFTDIEAGGDADSACVTIAQQAMRRVNDARIGFPGCFVAYESIRPSAEELCVGVGRGSPIARLLQPTYQFSSPKIATPVFDATKTLPPVTTGTMNLLAIPNASRLAAACALL